MKEGDLRFGVVGLGKMGILHSCILKVLPNVQVVGLCEKSTIVRRFFKRVYFDVKIVDEVGKLAGLDLNGVFVTTPIPSHLSVAKTVLMNEVARNLFVEKTLASNFIEAKELCESVHSLGDVNMVGYLRRFYVTFKKAKDLLLKGVLGEVSSFRAYAFSSDFLNTSNLGVSMSRGGVLRDLGCHALDLGLWFFGDLHVTSTAMALCVGSESLESVHFKVRTSEGIVGEFEVSWCKEGYRMPDVGLSIVGSEGTISVNDDKVELKLDDGRSSTWYRHDLNDNVPFWLGLPEYYREDLHFVESIMKGQEAQPSFDDAAKVDRIIDQVERMAAKNEYEK